MYISHMLRLNTGRLTFNGLCMRTLRSDEYLNFIQISFGPIIDLKSHFDFFFVMVNFSFVVSCILTLNDNYF